jgi:inhibitor of KinA sporulation pathway (predicted exonuclease)
MWFLHPGCVLALAWVPTVKNVLITGYPLIRAPEMPSSSQLSRPFAVVFDLEFTAWEGSLAAYWMRPGEYKELVQIGAVKVDRSFAPGERFDVLVRPRLNPVLSAYLEKLTGIANADVRARGVDFAEAYRAFVAFADGLPILAFGRDDLVLVDNIRLYGLSGLPPLPRFIDIRAWLCGQGIDVRGMHACDVGPAAGVPFEGQTHNGLHDALSVAAGMAALIGRGAPLPEIP